MTSYIAYHVERGVQQESLAASASWLASQVTGDPFEVEYRFRAQEVVGAEALGTVAIGVFGSLAALLAVRVWRRGPTSRPWLSAFALLLVILCASKVLSPQFIVLAVPLAAALGGMWCSAYLVIGVLSMVAFLDETKGDWFMAVVTVRNLIFLAVALSAALHAWRAPRLGTGGAS